MTMAKTLYTVTDLGLFTNKAEALKSARKHAREMHQQANVEVWDMDKNERIALWRWGIESKRVERLTP